MKCSDCKQPIAGNHGNGNLGDKLTPRLGSAPIPLCPACWVKTLAASVDVEEWQVNMERIIKS